MDSNLIIKFYQYFYSKVYHYSDFKYIPDPRDSKLILNFIDKLNSSLGEEWLFNYFAFQFQYWSEIKYKKFKGVVLSYILGKKALERYNKKNEKNWMYFVNKFISDFNLKINDLCFKDFYKKDFISISSSEEIDKNRFVGEERFANCLMGTTLYNVKSKVCVLCDYSKKCKDVLKIKYPYIYQIRNEETIVKENCT